MAPLKSYKAAENMDSAYPKPGHPYLGFLPPTIFGRTPRTTLQTFTAMSDNAAVVAIYLGARDNYGSSIASTVLFIYDYLITLDREVELFWTNSSKTAAPLLFYSIRYLGLLSVILTRVKALPSLSFESCDAVVKLGSVVDWLQPVPIGVFSGLRFFALSKGNWTMSLIVFALSVVPVGTNMSLFKFGLTGVLDPVEGCTGTTKITLQQAIILTIVTNAATGFANLIIIAVTWKTLGARSFRRLLSRDMHRGFAAILLWNGTIYFVALSLLSIIHVIFTITSIFYGGLGSALSLLATPLTSILVWRFMIDLQAANQSNLKIGSDDPLYLAPDAGRSLSFARATGSIEAIVTSDALECEDENHGGSAELEQPLEVDAVGGE